MKADTPIALANLTQMSPEEHEALLTNIRDRRLAPVRVYEELTLMQSQARREKLEEMWAKQLAIFQKDLARADKAMTTLEKRSTRLRAIKLEIEEL
jgi:predicted negative regulator of RcsB-dependent stress response